MSKMTIDSGEEVEKLEILTSIKDKLLRYCELDTLAMAMIVEAWKAELDENSFAESAP